MYKKNLFKKVALGLSMAALLIGTTNIGVAYAESGGGTSPAFQGAVSSQDDSRLYEKQREIDQYLFVDHVKEIENMDFNIIYTGVAESYVEIGITPYNDEHAAYLYDRFGTELVKVVDTDEVILYNAPDASEDDMPQDSDAIATSELPIMDMGDIAVSDGGEDEVIKERELSLAEEEERLTIQIESIGNSESTDNMDPELIWQTGIVEDAPNADIAEEASDGASDIKLVAAEDDMVTVTSVGDVENEDKGLPTASIIAIVAGGALIIGGTLYTSAKKKAVKKD